VARSILIVKLAAIGDVVMALPMISAVKAKDPGAHITWLCGRSVEPLLACVQGIDELVAVDDAALLAGRFPERVAALIEVWLTLRWRRFDECYIAHGDPRYRHLVRFLRTPIVRRLGGAGRQRLIPGRAYTDEYVRLVTQCDDHRARPFAPPRVEARLPGRTIARLPGDRVVVALAPGGARNVARDDPLRRWPLERYVDLASRLTAAGVAVALTGAPSDTWVRPGFAGLRLLDVIGETTLPELLAFYRHCAAVVTHDSGPLHLAGLAGTPRVALFGPTHPSSFVKPDPSVRVVWPAGGRMPCAPCYDGKNFAACGDNRCMQAITVSEVLAQVLGIVADQSPAGRPP
jgi:heptosyltransferase-2